MSLSLQNSVYVMNRVTHNLGPISCYNLYIKLKDYGKVGMILYFIHSFVVHVTLLLLTNFDCVILTIDALLQITIYTPEKFVIVENLRLVCLLDLTADFGVKLNTKLTPKCQLRERESKTGIQSCLYCIFA